MTNPRPRRWCLPTIVYRSHPSQPMEKKTSNANRLALKRILGQEGNGRCADCKTASHPRWASWNIGILICIRCSGVHRSLGTHISKVRSIDLDTWNDTQLEKLLEFGNARANTFWESKLPANYVPDESKIVNFIKTKYELRRWIPDEKEQTSATQAPKLAPKVRGMPTTSVDLLDLDGVYAMKASKPSEPVNSTISAKSTNSGSTASAPLPRTAAQSPASAQPRAPLSQTSTPPSSRSAQNSRTDVKKSILSLYSQPRQPTPSAVPSASSSGASFASLMAPSPAPSQSSSYSYNQAPSMTSFTTAASHLDPAASTEFRSEPTEDLDDNFANVWK